MTEYRLCIARCIEYFKYGIDGFMRGKASINTQIIIVEFYRRSYDKCKAPKFGHPYPALKTAALALIAGISFPPHIN